MNYQIDIQHASQETLPISDEEITELACLALRDQSDKAELTLRFVGEEEMTYLNHSYRQQNKATNVLAFPSQLPSVVDLEFPLLGDVIICPQVLARESKILKRTLKEHWSLILIHGVLHLLGYDHLKDEEAKIMQAIEIRLLAELGYENPYLDEDG